MSFGIMQQIANLSMDWSVRKDDAPREKSLEQ